MQQKQINKTRQDTERTEEIKDPPHKGDELKKELDDLLDDIDSVLEENASDFLKSYIQKGGE